MIASLGCSVGESAMKADSDQYLNRLVVAALTVFVVVSLLLAAFIGREIWLQQRIVGLSSSLQTNLEELEQTTEEIQIKVSALETTTERAPETKEWENVNDLLEDVDQQLVSIGETIDDVAIANEDAIAISVVVEDTGSEPTTSARVYADQVFTIFAVLTGIAAIAIALLLGMALRVKDNRLPV